MTSVTTVRDTIDVRGSFLHSGGRLRSCLFIHVTRHDDTPLDHRVVFLPILHKKHLLNNFFGHILVHYFNILVLHDLVFHVSSD